MKLTFNFFIKDLLCFKWNNVIISNGFVAYFVSDYHFVLYTELFQILIEWKRF